MSDETVTAVGDVLRVLVVGDSEPVDATMAALSGRLESVSLLRERTPESALERLTQLEIHCAVCPFGTDGTDPPVLEHLRDRDAEVPIVAVLEADSTDDGTATSALEAGATDVVDANDPASIVATRVRNAGERYRLATASPRHRSPLEHSDALVWMLDPEGRLEYASPAVESRLGYTPAELERTPLSQLIHPDDRGTALETLESVSAAAFGTTDRSTVRLGHADGSWVVYELTYTNRLADPDVGGIVLTLSTASAPEPDEPVRTALDRLADPLFSLGPRWELRYANDAASRLFVTDTVPESGTVVWDHLPETVRGRFAERLREATTTDRSVEFETAYPPLESRLVVSVHPGEDGVTVYAREAPGDGAIDRDRFDLLEELVDALDDGIAVLEGSTIRFANAALFELTGAETLVGREVDDALEADLAAAIRERADSPAVRWMTPLSGMLAGDDGRAVDVYVAPLSDERTLCVVRDGRRSGTAALSALERAIATVRTADAPGEVRRAVVEAALDRTGADLASWYRLEDDVLRPAVVEAAADPGSIDLSPIETGERAEIDLLARLEAGAESDDAVVGTVVDRSEIEPVLARAGIRAERVLAVSAGDHGLVLATSTDPSSFGEYDRLPLEAVVGAATTALEGLERATAVRTCRADLDRLETVVERCRQVRGVERTLLAAETSADVEERLCEALVAMPFDETPGTIGLAWVGTVATGADRVTPSSWAGGTGVDLESVAVSIDPGDDPAHPAARAATTLEPATVEDLAALEGDREWSRRLLEDGFRTVLSVPLVVDEFCYGILTAAATRPSAFDERTRTVCTHLAAIASHTIAALERRRALLSDRVTELEVALRDDDEPLSAIAGRLDRRLDVRAVVPRSAGGATVFAAVPDGIEIPIETLVESIPALESGRIVGDRGATSVLELVFADATVATTLAGHGGVLRSVSPTEDRTRLVVDLPSTVDVRAFVRMLERRHPGATPVARRERDRSIRPVRAFDAELRDRLSERQLRTLETAYYSGFFEWPRESTGEEVADALGVSQPTFSRHLRLAQGKVFASLFDEGTDPDEQ